MSAPGIPPDIASIAAPVLLGYLFNWGLYGILTMQVYVYYLAFPNDKLWFKCVVYGLYIMDTLQSILVAHDAFNGYAKGFGDLTALGSIQMEWLATPILTGLASFTVQLCYTYRIYVLSRSKILCGVISAIALTQAIASIVTGVQALQAGEIAALASEAFVATSIWLSGSALCDVLIAVSMTFLLARKDTGMVATHASLTKLIRLVVETGSLTATTAIIDLVLFLDLPHKAFHGCVALVLAKFYSNSLLVVFNSRLRIANGRNDQTASHTSSISFRRKGGIGQATTLSLGDPSRRPGGNLLDGIHVQEETWTDNIQLDSQASLSVKKTSFLPHEV
ncbi:uncharacterized protein FOMMEDRAFT_22670 [Fomitiporia mediterranea MF3/22]|uniref:uncharacterized protein n=1 Tax=Fomitiporia mediterranea (strain MF3/22) TaxID=694068 RepID=UPI0004409909|nr:uncharacterized protein FOMMEDRAFT_22670 [Fomitiporia mediterranea MF3/22]EJD00216.1 hypothetical protein FOMMEDRAFT_22670 [Fomitiporia mediterranea MF3/22]